MTDLSKLKRVRVRQGNVEVQNDGDNWIRINLGYEWVIIVEYAKKWIKSVGALDFGMQFVALHARDLFSWRFYQQFDPINRSIRHFP